MARTEINKKEKISQRDILADNDTIYADKPITGGDKQIVINQIQIHRHSLLNRIF